MGSRWARYTFDMWVRSVATAMAITIAVAVTVTTALTLAGCRRDHGEPPPPPPPAAQADPLWDVSWPRLPQLPDAAALYDSLPPLDAGAQYSGLLVCRIAASPNAATRDVFSGPDLALQLTPGAGPSMIVRGSSDSWSSTVTLPAVDLARGGDVRARIWDHDDLTDGEHIADLAGPFTGAFPLRLLNGAGMLECRGMAASDLEQRVTAALRAADSALDAFAALPAADFVSNRTRANKQVEPARRAITTAAAHVGWHVDRIRERVARAQELERDWQRRVQAARDERVAKLPAPGELVPLDAARVAVAGALDCDAQRIARDFARAFPGHAPDGVGCLLRVDVTPVAGATFDWYTYKVGAKLVTRDGQELAVHERWAELDGAPLTGRPPQLVPGKRISVVYVAGTAGTRVLPELATVSIRKATALIRVR